jgi:endonuclease YncB( thermonuclease family)
MKGEPEGHVKRLAGVEVRWHPRRRLPRMKRLAWFLPVAAAAAAVLVVTTATARGPFTQRAVVVRALTGDSLLVRLPSGKQERVRVLGISAPAAGACHGGKSLARLRAVIGRKRVTLVGDGTSRVRDSAKRLLAYVRLPNGFDLGRGLIADGAATADVWGAPFGRLPTYAATQQLAEKNVRGLWSACGTDVAVKVESSDQAYELGANATYTLSVTNSGRLEAPAVSVDLRPSAGGEFTTLPPTCKSAGWHATCSFGDLAPGASASLQLGVKLTQTGVASLRAASTFTSCVRAPCGAVPLADTNRDNDTSGSLALVVKDIAAGPPPTLCDPSYPSVCIPSPPPDLDCNDLPFREFRVRRDVAVPDPHRLDQSEDGIACQFDDY